MNKTAFASTIFLATFLFLAAFPTPSRAQEKSIFFTDPEQDAIYKQLEKLPQKIADEKDMVSLDAIIYKTPNNWTVWLNGTPWTPEIQTSPDLRLVSVSAKSVRVSLDPPTSSIAPAKTFVLRLNQKLNKRTGEIFDATKS